MLKYSLPVSNFHHCFALTIYVDLGREEMKLQQISYARSINNNNAEYDRRKKNPSFGNLAVGLASFIENNGFLGEFLTIDTVGMMAPRTAQGYMRNSKELGHPNYKAGREELIRELLSGPAFFYVPLIIITLTGLLRGKAAKVQTKVLENFKSLMQKTTVNLKDANATKNNFVDTVINKAFGDYKNETGLVNRLKDLMKQNLQKNTKRSDRKEIRKEADQVITKLNKANGRFLDNASTIKLGEQAQYNVKDFFQDMSNYLDDFTNKAQKTDKPAAEFIEHFHKKAKDLRNITNIMAVSALSAFLMLVPKLYQTSKKFPGKDGLNTGEANDANNAAQAAQAPKENQVKEAV